MSNPANTKMDAEIAAWQAACDTERRLTGQIVTYALDTWRWPLVNCALALFAGGRYSSDSLLKLMPVFDRWLAYSWIARLPDDDFASADPDWPTVPVGIAWLASGATEVSAGDRTFVERAAASPFTFLQVEHVEPGWCLTASDLLTSRRLRIVDPEVSARARPDDVLLSAVLTIGGISVLLGPAPYTAPLAIRTEAIEIRDCYNGARWMTRQELLEYDLMSELCGEYREYADRGPCCLLHTLDTDSVRVPLHLEWTLSVPVVEVLEALRPLTNCAGDDSIQIDASADGEPYFLVTWFETIPGEPEDDYTMRASLYVTGTRLSAEVPSRSIADLLISEVASRLGGGAVFQSLRSNMPVRVHDRRCWLPVPPTSPLSVDPDSSCGDIVH